MCGKADPCYFRTVKPRTSGVNVLITSLVCRKIRYNETLKRSTMRCGMTVIEASPFSLLLYFRQSPLACVSQPKRSSLANLITIRVRVSKVAI
jgi:hypothetical protein